MTDNQFQPRRSKWFARQAQAKRDREAPDQAERDRQALVDAGLRPPPELIMPAALDPHGRPTSRFSFAGHARLVRDVKDHLPTRKKGRAGACQCRACLTFTTWRAGDRHAPDRT